MKISPISSNLSKPGFKGQYSYTSNENSLKDNKLWHKNSSVETTLGSYHVNRTSMAYFADPLEPISDSIKEKADFIVYDNEPAYPDIDEVGLNYFKKLRKNFKDDFEEVRQYFYRREMGGFANVEEAKAKQKEAAECTRMYDNAGHLRWVKETAEDEADKLNANKADILAGIKNTEQELKAQQEIEAGLEKHIANLKKIQRPYKELNKLTESGSSVEQSLYATSGVRMSNANSNKAAYNKFQNTQETYQDIRSANTKKSFRIADEKTNIKAISEKLEKTIAKFEEIKAACAKTIQNMQTHISDLKTKLSGVEKTIAEKEALIKDCGAKLIPLFDELKNFYAKQGIKGIKRL